MRRLQQKVILIIFSVLCAFFLYDKWRKYHFLIGSTYNDDLATMASKLSWLHWDSGESQNKQVRSQYSHMESQEQRKANVRSVCQKNNLIKSSLKLDLKVAAQLYVEHSHKFIYCEVPKVGCTNWKRIILLLNKSLNFTLDNITNYQVHGSKLLTKLSSYPPSRQKELLGNYTKVMFTRDPLERVVSAYRDKFFHGDRIYYSKTFANVIRKALGINSDTKITFEQFTRFILKENPSYRDTHWRPMYQLCDPCNIQYDIIGKIETIAHDADFVLRTIGAPQNLKYPTLNYQYNVSRTNYDLSIHYLEVLPPSLFRKLMNVYSLDFSMFEYSIFNNTVLTLHKRT